MVLGTWLVLVLMEILVLKLVSTDLSTCSVLGGGTGGFGGWHSSANVRNFDPRLLRNSRSSSDSRRLQLPTEPAGVSRPSYSYNTRPSVRGGFAKRHLDFCKKNQMKILSFNQPHIILNPYTPYN